ncbi:hypothetical protein MKX01_000605 [Papaver californicum]|nr:hypothetical protein MKX01_000605 [Papaver californicum]
MDLINHNLIFLLLLLVVEVPSVEALTCGAGETYVLNRTCISVPISSAGLVLLKSKNNVDCKAGLCRHRGTVCEGCCGKPSPAPPRPIYKCKITGHSTVSREMCTYMAYKEQSIFVCNCCCRRTDA